MANRPTKSTVDYTKATPILIAKEPKEQKRREYTTLRDIIQKRLTRIDKAAARGAYDDPRTMDPRDFPFYQYWAENYNGRVPKLKELPTDKALNHILSIMKQQIGVSQTSYNSIMEAHTTEGWETATQKGLQEYVKNRVKGLQEAGYTEINEGNLAEFGKFMEAYRAHKLDHVVSSPDAVEVFISIKDQQYTRETIMDSFSFWLAERDRVKNLTPEEFRTTVKTVMKRMKKGKGRNVWET